MPVEKLSQDERQRFQRILQEFTAHQIAADRLSQQIRLLDASLSELLTTTQTVRAISELEPGTEILVPIGSGSFASAKLALNDRVIIGLGADIAAERGINEALQTLEARSGEVRGALERLQLEFERLGERIEELRPEVERILAKVREERREPGVQEA